MALVHEQLYGTPDLAQIDFAAYVQDLTVNLLGAYRVTPDQIALKVDVGDVFLEVDQAIPCGLIVTELVTNVLKHAFPAGRDGEKEIRVAFDRTAGGAYELVVSDNGVGLPAGFEFPTRDSVGMLLLNAHARGLKATVEWESDGGTTCRVVF
jgi:two-component sensor histidine kinase